MDSSEMVYCASRREWRAWLMENHTKSKGIWLIYYKKGSGKPRIPYDDAVEEALCFGWIDSTMRPIDGACYAQRYTPRKPDSVWSELNIARVERLIKEGRMTEAGLAVYRSPKARKDDRQMKDTTVPPGFFEALEKDAEALAFFSQLTPSQVKLFFRFINDAKREETRQKRITKAVEVLAQHKKRPAE